MADALARAYEISRPAVDTLRRGRPGRVLSVFARACNLLLDETHVVTLVGPASDLGPFHLTVEAGAPFDGRIGAGTTVRCERGILRVGGLAFDWAEARVFEPRPDWERLRRQLEAQGESAMEHVQLLALRHAQRDTLLGLLEGPHADLGPPSRMLWIAAVRRGAEPLRAAARAGDAAAIADATRALAGLGPGSTPAGDDFLAGAMLRAHLSSPQPEAFCAAVVEAAAPLTLPLSVAFLRAAAAGECSRAWHRLFEALAAPGHAGLEPATLALLSQGASSGADALAGWLFF
jgi:hypothetical protein